jgi:hypothetical protein
MRQKFRASKSHIYVKIAFTLQSYLYPSHDSHELIWETKLYQYS